MTSVWVYEKTWPTCSEPLTVGGGVSIAYTAIARRRAIESIDCALFPARDPFVFEAFEGGLFWNV